MNLHNSSGRERKKNLEKNAGRMNLRMAALLLFAGILLFVSPPPSFGHPHVFIDAGQDFVFDGRGLSGFHVRWVFDEFFSSMMMMDYDRNKNGRFEPSEVDTLKKGAFDNLANFEYFTSIEVDKKPKNISEVENFSASINDGILSYTFFIPCSIPAASAYHNVVISQYDSSYYCEILPDVSEPVRITKGGEFDIEYRTAENPERSYYFGLICPVETILKFRLKNE